MVKFHSLRRLCATLVAGLCVVSLAGCGPQHSYSDTTQVGVVGPRIRIGIPLEQPALSMRAGSTYSGFSIDVAQFVADQLGYAAWQIEWVETPPNTMAQHFVDGSIDIAAGLFVPDSQLDEITQQGDLLLASAYAIDDTSAMVIRHDEARDGQGDITATKDILGKQVCTVSAEDLTQRQWPGMTRVIQQPSVMQCATALMSGMVDAVVAPRIALTGIASNSLEDDISGRNAKVLDEPLDTGAYYMVVKPGATTLQQRVVLGLQQMVKTGKWKQASDTLAQNTGIHVSMPNNLKQ